MRHLSSIDKSNICLIVVLNQFTVTVFLAVIIAKKNSHLICELTDLEFFTCQNQ